jgi:hemolysin activation/secretion protein
VALKAVSFYDRAQLRRLYALSTELANVRLGSAGLGLRLETGFGLQATIDWAHILDDTSRLDNSTGLQMPVSGRKAGSGQRWSFALRQSF